MDYSIKIIDLDFYMNYPLQGLDVMYSKFRGTSVNQVPVLMLFGTTSTGEKICAHIHGVFPYLYIPYDGSEEVNSLMYKIASNIDKAVNISLNQASSTAQHVYKITVVSGIPMYGYHAKNHQFLKIYLYNPLLIKKVGNLLMNSSTLGRIYQPHETHLNFTLQFMIDFNLHGMSNLITSNIKFRIDPERPTPNIDPEFFLPSHVSRMSRCELEGDILAEDITNREEIMSGNIKVNPGIATIWADEMQRRRNKGETSQIEHLLELSRTAEPTKSHVLFKQALSDRLAALSNETKEDKSHVSVYPAETPISTNIQNSSLYDYETPTSSLELSLDATGNFDLNDTSLQASASLDEDAFKLLDILNNLGDNEVEEAEEDSILIQTTKSDDDNELEMSMSWETSTTPTKNILAKSDNEDGDEDLNKTIIPQLDGGNDDMEKYLPPRLQQQQPNEKMIDKTVTINNTKHFKKYMNKAFFVQIVRLDFEQLKATTNLKISNYPSNNNSIGSQVSMIEKTNITKIDKKYRNFHEKTKKELKQLWYRVKKLNYKNQIFTVMKKMHEKEKHIQLMLNKTSEPTFNIISRGELQAPYKLKALKDNCKLTKVPIINDIIKKTSRYIEPTLHFIVKYPNYSRYLFNYKSDDVEPKIKKIPKKVYRRNKKKGLKTYVKNQMQLFCNNNTVKCDNRNLKDEPVYTQHEVKFSDCDHNQNSIQINDQNIKNEFDETLPNLFHYEINSSVQKLNELQQELKRHKEILKLPSYCNLFHDKDFNDNKYWLKPDISQNYTSDSLDCFDSKPSQAQYNYSSTSHPTSLCYVDNEDKTSNENLLCNELRRSSRIKYAKYSSRKNDISDSQNLSDSLSKNLTQGTGTQKGNQHLMYTRLSRIKLENENEKLCLSLDGTVDDSSSDEDETHEFYEHSKFLKTNSGLPNKNLLENCPEVENIPLSKIDSVKRKINFREQSETFIEEKLICSFSPAKVSRTCKKSKPVTVNEKNELLTKGTNIQETVSSENSDSTEYSDDNVHNKSFFNSENFSGIVDNLTTANKYDIEKNYKAKEGTSKFLTPDDENQQDDFVEYGQEMHISRNNITDSISYQQNIEKEPSSSFENISTNTSSTSSSESCSTIIIKPLKCAISRIETVKSLDKFKIPHVKNEEPFYSNIDDATKQMEIGYSVLKVRNKSSIDLQDFQAQTEGFNVIRKTMMESISLPWNKSNVKKITLASCKEKNCIILPMKRPPTSTQVQDWLIKKCKNPIPEKNIIIKKNSIFIPCSSESMNLSLSLTPSTPSNSHSYTIEQHTESTSESSTVDETLVDPLLDEHCNKRKIEMKHKKLAKSMLKLSQNSSRGTSQITGATINNSYGFKNQTADLKEARAIMEYQYLTVMVIELHITTRGDFKPDPSFDPITAIFYAIFNDVPDNYPNKPKQIKGAIVLNVLPLSSKETKSSVLDGLGQDCDIKYVDSEENMLLEFVKLVHFWDPDIVAGYEIELLSWGYLIDRAYVLGMNLKPLLDRLSLNKQRNRNDDTPQELKIIGRIVLNVWRLMRYEIALQSYTLESVVYHILHKRLPSYSFKDLTFWWNCKSNVYRHRVVDYYLLRVVAILELFDKLDFIGLTSELARLFGILFYEVLSRGSQFRVEAMMLRLAKPPNFIPVSPSVEQRAHMKAPEYIALILEPESKLYNDPVIVLDFQSLYPSIIIAYNYCFTTCIGRVELLGKNGPFEFGASQLKVPRKHLKYLLKKDLLNFSPCGVGFVKRKVRDGILPRMLREILDTRLMVKNVMKETKDDPILQKVLHNRQLGLKLIANVTYGYTAANFSGRMPAVEVGDSVVSKGRETLQRAIEMVDNTHEWGARVVYGDTDSLFVLVPGKTKEQAFEIGKKIADAVTEANPDPIKLKLEKIYQPCILQTKKRYVGYMYENVNQKEPIYDAKGIETVRRDGCPAVTKMLEKCLKLLFETKDVSLIKQYVLRQFNKLIAGRVSIQDLTFAKEYRGASGYRPGACVPALELTRKWTMTDKRNEPRSGERVPYVIVNGPPGLPLIRLVRSPRDLLNDPSLRPNIIYYITRVIIPPLNRCFNLIGADLLTWYHQMPRKQIKNLPGAISPEKKSTISQYFSTISCILCSEQTQTGICDKCSSQPQSTVISIIDRIRLWEQHFDNCTLICQSCTSMVDEIKCISLDCPILYRRIQMSRDVQNIPNVRQLLDNELLF